MIKKKKNHNIIDVYIFYKIINFHKHRWFSGKISRCHRGAPGSIPGRCINFYFNIISNFF